MFSHVKKVTLRLHYIAQGVGTLPPYLGSTIRGLIGHSLRNMVCQTPKVKCHTCDYANYFVSPKNEVGSVNRMILKPIVQNKTAWKKGDSCVFDVTIISTTAMPLLIQAFENINRLGWGSERIQFRLEKIINAETARLVWFNYQTWFENMLPTSLQVTTQQATTAILHFPTPLRLEKSKKLIAQPEFEHIIKAISRRLNLLSHAYAGYKIEWDYEAMLEEAKAIKIVDCQWQQATFTRYSMNQKNQKLQMDVLTGWVRYEGNITPFTPLLAAGEVIHIGRNATHGFGAFTTNYA